MLGAGFLSTKTKYKQLKIKKMITREEFLKAIETINAYKKQVSEQFEKMKSDLDEKDFSHLELNENTSIYDADLSVKSMNILRFAEIEKLGDLKEFKRSDLFRFRGLGKKGLNEIEKCLLQAGIVLVG